MTARPDPDVTIAAWLHDEAPERAPELLLTASRDRIRSTHQRRAWGPAGMTRPVSRTTLAAAVVVAVVALGGAVFVIQRGLPVVAGPDPTASADPSPSLPAVVAPSSTPSATAPNPSAFPRTTGVWIATGSMGTPRSGHDAVRLLDGRVLVVGGANGDQNDTSAELYDPASGTWSATGNMLKRRGGFPATLLRDGRVLVGDADDRNLGAEVYDPVSGTWTVAAKMLAYSHSATLLAYGKVLVVHNGDRAELYDPATGTWTATGKMATLGDYRGAVLLRDGRVLLAGGTAKSAELYDPATGTWAAIANMKTWRNPITLTLLPDGKVLVMGGDGSEWIPPDLYDPVAGTWTPTADFARPGPVSSHLAGGTAEYGSPTLLSDGMVLVAEEYRAQLYDPGTGSLTTTGYMLRGHDDPLTLLLDGTVLVAGGRDCDGRPVGPSVCIATGSAELYVPRGLSPPVGLPAAPSPTPILTPTPTPTSTPIPPQDGPIPPGARSWNVRVVNKSDQPATLFVAEEDTSGMTRLVGSVTPNVVPAGATLEVTFLLPAKGANGFGIFVNPGPANGALLSSTDVPLAGEIHITADGQVGWLSP